MAVATTASPKTSVLRPAGGPRQARKRVGSVRRCYTIRCGRSMLGNVAVAGRCFFIFMFVGALLLSDRAVAQSETPGLDSPADSTTADAAGNAADNGASEPSRPTQDLEGLIKANAFMNPQGRERMLSLLPGVPAAVRNALFTTYRRNDAGLATVLNLLGLSLGVDFAGSLIQFDWLGVAMEAGPDIVAIGLVIWGLRDVGLTGFDSQIDAAGEQELNTVTYVALGLALVGVVASLIRPWVWQDQWNRNLSLSLGIVSPDPSAATTGAYEEPAPRRNDPKVEADLASLRY
jgi:hypothetical protein